MRRLVPNFIIQKFKSNERSGNIEAAAIFVDLSGFSKLTDALAKHGQHGAEVLAELMRVVFEPLVSAVYAHGGFVIGYAGDAFNAVFPADQSSSQAAKRCLAALADIQAHVRSHPQVKTVYGDFPISIKAGMGFGQTRWQIFTSKDGSRATYWFRGDSLSGAVLAEKNSSLNEITLDPVAYEILKDGVDVEPANNCHRIINIRLDLPKGGEPNEPQPDAAATEIFFPPIVSHQPNIGEFRQVVNLFIDIPLNISDEALVTPFMETVYVLQERYGGFFLRPDLGDKGFNLLLFWGAPIANEKDIEHALNFVLELSARTKIEVRAGVTYRIAYAGFMGAPMREDYTAYGWGVNLAARLMEYANVGEIWLDEEIASRADAHFHVKFLDEYAFKGFAKKQGTWRLGEKKQIEEKIYHGNLIGREQEMKALAEFFEPLQRGKYAGVVMVRGEAGVGKSRLVHTFQHSDFFKDAPANWVTFQTEEMFQQSFQPFKAWIKRRFGVVDGLSDDENWETFSRIVEEIAQATPDETLASELTRTASVLAAMVNINQPDTLYESLDAEGRYENTFIALSALFRAESLKSPLVLFMEDLQWLDEDSNAFLSYLIRTLLADPDKDFPIAVLTTQRPEHEIKVIDAAPIHSLQLGGLTAEKLGELAHEILGMPISKSLQEILNKRADGNPFIAEQVLRYLSETDSLQLSKDREYTATEKAAQSLPVDVRAVMIARLDRLSQQVRDAVQTASALGREFEVEVLAAMLHHQAELPQYVGQAQRANIWAPLSEIEYIFRHTLLRDAAYSMQLLSRQRELHRLAVSAMEEVYRDDLEPHYGELAFHAEKGDLRDKALHYLSVAGDSSLKDFLNRQASDYYARALAFVPEDDPRKTFELLEKRAECVRNLSDAEAMMEITASMETIARSLADDKMLTRVLTLQASSHVIHGDYPKAVEIGLQAKELAEKSQDTSTLLSLHTDLPDALTHTGKLTEARQLAKQGVELARKAKDLHAEAYTLTALGLAVLQLEGPTAARAYQEQALALAQQLKDRNLEAKVLNNLANSVGMSLGDYHAAREYFEQALVISREQGNQRWKGLVLANLGWLSGILGDYPSAMEYYEQGLKIARELSQKLEELYTYINLSATSYGRGDADAALQWAERAQEQAVADNNKIAEGWALFYLGYAHLLGGKFGQAVDAFRQSIAIREETDAAVLIVESRAGLVEAFTRLQNQAEAKEEAERVLEYMQGDPSFEGTEEPLRMYQTIHKFLQETKDPRSAAVLQNAIGLMEAQVSKLRSEEARRMFVENVPWRRALQQAAKA